MSSTENLLQDPDKSTNTLESGYHSDSNGDGEAWHKQKDNASKKKKSQRNLGLENKGFESDSEHVNTPKQKVQVHRALSESANSARQTTTKERYRVDKRRHSYAGRASADATKLSDGVTQNTAKTRRRLSSADEDLRRIACLNSMLRRVSSSSQQPLPEVDVSVDDDVFYDDDFGTGAQKKSQGIRYGENREKREKSREYAMGITCSAVELENRKLSEYSRRLSSALEERAKLEDELINLRRAASVPSLPAHENWKNPPKIHFRNEKFNSVRRNGRGSEDKTLSFEQLRQIQMGQSRRLPEVPQSFSSGEYEFLEEIPPVIEEKVQTLPQRNVTEDFPLYLEEKSRTNDRFHEETQHLVELETERFPQRNPTRESTQHIEENVRSDRFFLSEIEKERRERKIADLAADLWRKLLQGEKFHGDGEPSRDKTSNDSTAERESSKIKKSENLSYAKSGMREKMQAERIAKVAEDSGPTTSGLQESQTRIAKGKTPVHSELESHLEHTGAFRRNQRRPVRYKRGSVAAESLIGAARPSTSRFSEGTSDSLWQVQQQETKIPRQVQTERTNRLQPAQSEKLGTEVVSQNHSKWFDYMLPPGKRGNRKENPLKYSHSAQFPQRENAPAKKATSLQDKLRYYQELQEKRAREENSFDLADAYMAAQDGEEQNELRRQAAGRAAILKREASHLLWEAMDLERICDPNARVRHIFTPY